MQTNEYEVESHPIVCFRRYVEICICDFGFLLLFITFFLINDPSIFVSPQFKVAIDILYLFIGESSLLLNLPEDCKS